MKKFVQEHTHALWAIYLVFYTPWFLWLERNITAASDFYDVTIPFDHMIPFCEYFIIPYYLWFALVPAVWIFLCLKDRQEFYSFIGMLYIGMTLFLLISTFFPNGQTLRSDIDPDKNFFTWLVHGLYEGDTSTNVFPSLHAYNSIVCCIAVMKSRHLKNHPLVCWGSLVLTVLICMATVFLKQHSIIDSIGALILSGILYPLCYIWLPKQLQGKS